MLVEFWQFLGDNILVKLMRKYRTGSYAKYLLLVAFFVVGSAGTAMATTSVSPSYQVSETEFGAGSALESCSGQYCANASIGDVFAGTSNSPNHTASFGKIAKDSEPLLEVIVQEVGSDLGVLGVEKTSSKSTSIKIRNYMSDGYTLHIIGDPPKYENHSLKTNSTPTDALPGTEQFGINLVANTIPEVGKDPVQTPSEEFSFGEVWPDYNVANKFMYESGAVVASSDSETGQTEYTVSMIVNVAGSTPAGRFAGDYQVVVIPAF